MKIAADGARLRVLCLGAHCDDIEIGCGGALLALIARRRIEIACVGFSATDTREREFRGSLGRFLRGAKEKRIIVHRFRDGFFPAEYAAVKEAFEALKALPVPDVVFTHQRSDFHQDHRIVAELTWNTFRRHLILEYEIAKYEGGLTTPNAYVALTRAQAERKARILMDSYATQTRKHWFTQETFMALMRLRGIESGAPEGWAEGFHASKLLIG